MKYLTPYHEFCDKIFARAATIGLDANIPLSNYNQYGEFGKRFEQLAHKLDVVHCINGFIGEVYELDEHLLALECGDFTSTDDANELLQEARQELGDLCYYRTQLQTLLINSPHKPNLVTWNNTFEQELDSMRVFEFNEIVNNAESFKDSVAFKMEYMLNQTKKLIFYGHDGSFTQLLNEMTLIINGYRVYDLDWDIEAISNSGHKLQFYIEMNMTKLAKRHPSGKFTPEAAAAKADQN
jgi:hypothetical protein